MNKPSAIKDWNVWKAHILATPECAVPADLTGRWCVAHTRPRNEKALARELQARGVFFYLPLSVNTSRGARSGRLTRSLVSVFPSYIFLNCDERQRLTALQTNRIVKTLPVDDQQRLVEELRRIHRVIMTHTPFVLGPSIQAGSWARVTSGPLDGLEGVVLRKLSGTRLALNVKMLSQSVILEVSQDMLEIINPPPRIEAES